MNYELTLYLPPLANEGVRMCCVSCCHKNTLVTRKEREKALHKTDERQRKYSQHNTALGKNEGNGESTN